tara:strand:+ start:803 stop:922 length:120 start_codon:yes stop_codon:yes gene_type:complete
VADAFILDYPSSGFFNGRLLVAKSGRRDDINIHGQNSED